MRMAGPKPLWALIAAAALMTLGAAASPIAEAPEPEEIAPLPPEARISTTMSATDRMLAAVTIAGAGPYHFIVDTAAERSVISRQIAEELNLRPVGRGRVLSMTNARNIAMVDMPDVSFGLGAPRTMRAFALDGDHVGAAGVLGIDALRGQRVVLDFDAGEMRVGPAPRRAPRPGPNDIIVRGRTRYGQLVLIDSSAEGVPVDVIIDSGLQVSIGNEALRRLLVGRRHSFDRIHILSITGETLEADRTRVDNLRIGGVAIRGMPVAFANAYFFNRLELTRRPALMLGMDALRMFRSVSVDFQNRRAHFVLPDGVPAAE